MLVPFRSHTAPFVAVMAPGAGRKPGDLKQYLTPLFRKLQNPSLVVISKSSLADEDSEFRRMCRRNGWPVLVVGARCLVEVGITHALIVSDGSFSSQYAMDMVRGMVNDSELRVVEEDDELIGQTNCQPTNFFARTESVKLKEINW
jgi:hypothetical protein